MRIYFEDLDLYALKKEYSIARTMLDKLGEPYIMTTSTLENIILNVNQSYWCSRAYRLFYNYLVRITGAANIWEITERIADEDIEWSKQRNEGLTGKYYYKFTIKSEYVLKLEKFLANLLLELETLIKEKEDEKIKIEKEKEKFYNTFEIVYIYKLLRPYGGESGTDGYADMDLLHKETKNIVRMVARNVFDFGYYVYPKRVEGTDDVFNRKIWTEIERLAEKWLLSFPPFTTAMRM